jgi:hypothetical protein
MAKQFLDSDGLKTFFTQLTGLFATKDAVNEVKATTDPYIFDIDYSAIMEDATSAEIGVGEVGSLIIAKS